jgi:hypothetical protein
MTISILCEAQGTLFFRNLDHFPAFVAAAMRTGAVGELGLVAIGALGVAGHAQMVVGPARGGSLLGVSAFWIRHLVVPLIYVGFHLYFFKSGPAIVHEFGLASAVYQVTILTAGGTDPLALGAANALHRHTEQNVLAQNIFQFNAAAFVESDFGFSLIYLYFFLAVLGFLGRAVEQIEAGIDRKLGRLQATITIAAHGDRQMSPHSNFPERMRKKLRGTFHLERSSLA